jgi:pullulanase/glycogen debranching enzyme
VSTIEITPETTLTRPRWLVVHYARDDEAYADWALYAWGDVAPGQVLGYPNGHPFAGEDAYGRFAWVRLADDARDVGFLVVDRNGVKDVPVDRHVDPRVAAEIWLTPGVPDISTAGPSSDPSNAVIHYRRADGSYDGWGLHAWEGTFAKPRWDRPLAPARFDAFGAVFEVPVRPEAVGLRFVIHHGDTKDLPDDQRLDLTAGREVWLLSGIPAPVRPDLGTLGPALDPARALAVFLDRTTIVVPPFLTGAFSLVPASGEPIPLVARPGGLFQAQARKYPHLRGYAAFSVRELGDAALGALLEDQLLVVGRDDAGEVTARTSVQLAGVLDDLYADAADVDLGLVLDNPDRGDTLSVWAPTARTVTLELFDSPADEPSLRPMTRDALSGAWSIPVDRGWLGRYYRYRVEVWHPAAQRVVTTSVTDPYSLGLAADSTHSLLVDLTDPALFPPGWEALEKPPAPPPARIQIAEVSVRDFSIFDASVPPSDRGTFLAFTHPESAGMTHLRSLASAGLTHLHLLPAFDFGSVPERRADQSVPACDLASLPPDSDQQQAAVMAVADTDGFNWGYDPLHYTAPEGSFAVEPDGAARILEFRRMVAALNAAGLRVVMDVVYNHTMADGLEKFSVLDRIVPGYYQRLLADGTTAESTCCPNTATENMMMGRLVIDSVVTWATAYKVDGFRFDLMGHHPRANVLETRIALDHVDPGIYVYGEGWNFGEVANDARFIQATQLNMAGTGVGTFNDRLRDAVQDGLTSQWRPDQIKVGLAGGLAAYQFVGSSGAAVTGAQVDYNGSPSGYASAPGETVNYVDAHDNEILYDALAFSLPPDLPMIDRARMQVLALSFVVLSQGVGFVALGSDRLRSKSLDRNSFNSGDWFNQIRWDPAQGNGFGLGLPPADGNADRWPSARPLLADPALVPPPDVIELAAARYRELLTIRRSTAVFGLPTADEVQRRLTFPLGGPSEPAGVIVMCLDGTDLPDSPWPLVTVVFNVTGTVASPTLPGVSLQLHPALVNSADPVLRTATADSVTGTLTVPARSVAVFVAAAG